MNKIQETFIRQYVTSDALLDKIDTLNEKDIDKIIAIYSNIIKHNEAVNLDILARFIDAYIEQHIRQRKVAISSLLSEDYSLQRMNSLTDEEIDSYISLCNRARIGKLIYEPIMFVNYNTKDHIDICEGHLAYSENNKLADIITIAARHHAMPKYIELISMYYINNQSKILETLLMGNDFYNINSDFERIVAIEFMNNLEDDFAKYLTLNIMRNKHFTDHNIVIDLIKFIETLLKRDRKQCDLFMAELVSHPEVIEHYSADALGYIYMISETFKEAEEFFFDEFVINNLACQEALDIFAKHKTNQNVRNTINRLKLIIKLPREDNDILEILNHNPLQDYRKPEDDGTWIDILSGSKLLR